MAAVRFKVNVNVHELCGQLPVADLAGLVGACFLCVRPATRAGSLLGSHRVSFNPLLCDIAYLRTCSVCSHDTVVC